MSKAILGVLCSGRGTNLQSIMAAVASGQIPAEIGIVLTDKPEAKALDRAEKAGLVHVCVDRRQCASKQEFEEKLVKALQEAGVTLVILAGFMRILSPYFVQRFKGRILNIHPSLLPAFTGLHTHQRAIDAGCRFAGCTVHLVTAELDVGPILDQAVVPLLPDDTAESLAARVLTQEHLIYPRAVLAHLLSKI